jgi:membrane protease YdiL (CAAX protease family)
LPGLLVLGVVLGWLYERSGSLLPCVLVHAGFNALNIAMVLAGPGPE